MKDWNVQDNQSADALVYQIASDWRLAPLNAADKALCAYAEKLSRNPSSMETADLDHLRRHDFDDRAIHDATQIISYFNYINRIAESLGVEYETFIRPWELGAPSNPSTK